MTETHSAPAHVIGTIQTDTFCEGCGYNLHTQAVSRDERLGILITRCPECGRFAAVGQTTTAARAWLNRLATILLTVWVFGLLIVFGLCSLFLGLLSFGHMEVMTDYKQVSAPVPTTLPSGVTTYVGQYKFQYEVKKIPANDDEQQASQRWAQFWFTFFTIFVAWIVGMMFSSLLWHCKGPLRLLAFLPALLGCGIAAMIWISTPETVRIRPWGVMQIGEFFLIDLVTIAIALLLGRRFARVLVRVLVPPRARQHLAFLWIVDGKTLSPQ